MELLIVFGIVLFFVAPELVKIVNLSFNEESK